MGICISSFSAASRLKVTVNKNMVSVSRNASGSTERKLEATLSQSFVRQSQILHSQDIAQRISLLQSHRPSFIVQIRESKSQDLSRKKRAFKVVVPILDQTLDNSTIMSRRKLQNHPKDSDLCSEHSSEDSMDLANNNSIPPPFLFF